MWETFVMRSALLSALALGALLGLGAADTGVLAQIQPIGPNQSIQPAQPLGDWRTKQGRTPDASDTAECRSQARRGAGQGAGDTDSRYEHEARLYDQCMKGKGFGRE